MDVLYKAGHFRLAAAADGSWEVQMFNCGYYASALAARFGKTLVEIWISSNQDINYKVNGEMVDSLPKQFGEFFMDSTHRVMQNDVADERHRKVPAHFPGTCMDDPAGQVYVDIAQDLGPKNLNFRIEAAADAVTTQENDPYSLCNVAAGARAHLTHYRMADWPVQFIPHEKSLFTIGSVMCSGCTAMSNRGKRWTEGLPGSMSGNSVPAAQAHCRAAPVKDSFNILAETICPAGKLAEAQQACSHLSEDKGFFNDCQIDYCASGGNPIVAAEAENEEAEENPQPICASDGVCDAAGDCCNALKDQATLTLDNVVTNTLCEGGELRYGSALTQNGQTLDLVVKASGGDFECGGRLDASKFGTKNAQIGILAVNAGTSQAFEFTFVRSGTIDPVAPKSLMMSWLDIDQGKKGKQRESVEICGAADAIVTDDTEIQLSVTGDCVKAMSTTAGNGKDNPDNLEEMSQTQRARTIAYKVTGSSFTATLGVTKGHHSPRRFNFAGHPSVACVLKAE
jgi:hypothetical protein